MSESSTDLVQVRRALVSVSDKTGVVELCQFLCGLNITILSTGGTASTLRQGGVAVTDVSEVTKFPEMMDGRVKTLHPLVHGALLGVRGHPGHEQAMATHGITPIDLVVCNLYPFEATVRAGRPYDECVENVDIGGPSMIRSAAKNHRSVAVVTSPGQYAALREELASNGGRTTLGLRRGLARDAFAATAAYDAAIAHWMTQETPTNTATAAAAAAVAAPPTTRTYTPALRLKYGVNPHQSPAWVSRVMGSALPFEVLGGVPGYINLLDALNAWQLVSELRAATGLAAAASFKHVSPAGAAVAVPLDPALAQVYGLTEDESRALTPSATAYIRARQADPKSSFGDFAALSDVVDLATANVLKTCVSDGIIAPGYHPDALEVLTKKKNGAFVVLKADPGYAPEPLEFREVFGVGFVQGRNTAVIHPDRLGQVVCGTSPVPAEAARDLALASITLKYTQSNSVGYAKDGQMIGVGAGQQSRIDCTRLAGAKAMLWRLRQHPKVVNLPFKPTVKKQDRINAAVSYLENDFGSDLERSEFASLFQGDQAPAPLTDQERAAHLAGLKGVALSSDAFFPFRDNIDYAAKVGVSYIVQPGGSVQDDTVKEACQNHNITMVHSGVRLFHH